ncbi:MAG: DNA glycosylase, partial [bacterium]|nr:DNA glycosylase [bacterium]
APAFHLGYTLGSGQTFRWGRDQDGWWKGITYGTVFHLKQEEEVLHFKASGGQIRTWAGEMDVEQFLVWYLRILEVPRVRVPRGDRYLRRARDLLRGFRFVRQEPFECTLSYVLSVQAHMSLTKRRIQFLGKILGKEILFEGERYWTFPTPVALARLNGAYFRAQRFGWRSERLAVSAGTLAGELEERGIQDPVDGGLDLWRELVDELKAEGGTGVGLKVGKCIDLFALERMGAVPVDTWVLKFAQEWYGIPGNDRAVCAWAEARCGKWAGYGNEYLFAYYRELNGSTVYDRVISFCASDVPSAELPFEPAYSRT